MVRRLRNGGRERLDYHHLAEFLDDMAHSNRSEVETRLDRPIAHWLKCDYQPERRMSSCRNTIVEQANALARLFKKRTLRNHAEAVLNEVYSDAVKSAATQTRLPPKSFPTICPYTLDQLLQTDRVIDPGHTPEPPRPGSRRTKRRPPGGQK